MTASRGTGLLDSPLTAPFFADEAVAGLFTAEAEIGGWLAFEAALAEAEAAAGVIPGDAAAAIARACATLRPDPAALARAVAADGVAIPGLVRALRAEVGGEAASFVHWGATTQDVVDTGLVLRLRDLLGLVDARLATIAERLGRLAEAHRATPMAGRTWGQQATPITFGLKAAGWRAPLVRHRERIAGLKPRLLVVSFGGAAGTLSVLGDEAVPVARGLAARLGLGLPALPWHTQRDGLGEAATALALLAGSLAKIARDVAVLAQTEIGEVRETGGGSSTMPQKANPVRAEAIQALARIAHGAAQMMLAAQVQESERDPAGWMVEWSAVPLLAGAVGGALKLCGELLDDLTVDEARMAANLDDGTGLVFAEAASFALSAHMPRAEAQALVGEACREARASRRHLIDILAETCDAPVDWSALRDPAALTRTAQAFTRRAMEE